MLFPPLMTKLIRALPMTLPPWLTIVSQLLARHPLARMAKAVVDVR
jgi:hypothetical protein